MKRLPVLLVASVLLVVAVADTAGATNSEGLVGKLVTAKVCAKPTAVDAMGRSFECTSTDGVPIVVTAAKNRRSMLRSLEADRKNLCAGKIPGVSLTIAPPAAIDYLVGKNWWTPPFSGTLRAKIAKALDGKVRHFAC